MEKKERTYVSLEFAIATQYAVRGGLVDKEVFFSDQ